MHLERVLRGEAAVGRASPCVLATYVSQVLPQEGQHEKGPIAAEAGKGTALARLCRPIIDPAACALVYSLVLSDPN